MRTIHKVLIGAAIGAIVGILFAPNKGSITRRKLRRKGNQIKDKINDLKDGINEKIDTLKEDAEDMAHYQYGKHNENRDMNLAPLRHGFYCQRIPINGALNFNSR